MEVVSNIFSFYLLFPPFSYLLFFLPLLLQLLFRNFYLQGKYLSKFLRREIHLLFTCLSASAICLVRQRSLRESLFLTVMFATAHQHTRSHQPLRQCGRRSCPTTDAKALKYLMQNCKFWSSFFFFFISCSWFRLALLESRAIFLITDIGEMSWLTKTDVIKSIKWMGMFCRKRSLAARPFMEGNFNKFLFGW